MNEKLQSSDPDWIDQDDAPELTEEFFEHGEWKFGDRVVSPTDGTVCVPGGPQAWPPQGCHEEGFNHNPLGY